MGTVYCNRSKAHKEFLGLDEYPGLEGLEKALELIYTMKQCRVHDARAQKGKEFHPCKAVGVVEYLIY